MFLEGAIIGAIVGLLVVVLSYYQKGQKFKKLEKTVADPGVEYSALYHYASYKRYKHSFKFFDSFGMLYLIGKTLYYKTSETEPPLSFNLEECTIQQEDNWRLLKWFSITTHVGEKYYFNSNKMGLFINNSDETLKGLAVIKAKTGR